jgi:hypothetical protein
MKIGLVCSEMQLEFGQMRFTNAHQSKSGAKREAQYPFTSLIPTQPGQLEGFSSSDILPPGTTPYDTIPE